MKIRSTPDFIKLAETRNKFEYQMTKIQKVLNIRILNFDIV